MSAPGTSISALWFDHKGSGPSELSLQLHPFPAEMDGRIPAKLELRVVVSRHADGSPTSLVLGAAEALVEGGFLLGRDQVDDLYRQAGAWLAGTATHPVSSANDTGQYHVVNLTALAAARAEMTPGEYEVWTSNSFRRITVSGGPDGGVLRGEIQRHDGHSDLTGGNRDADLAGLVAEHNAMPVLAEVARAALAYADEAGTRFGDLDLLNVALAKVSL